ncbi:VOC family protein [Streptomyces sp. HNM0574]|uniref:VOC family protein n=1 Tax=Streptomyces sp. HNM0574 TaxID=2714954 RepID=UPI001469D3F4|nr:VOC family protein [Streptomyces sp. HNM0574]NLU68753.1 VOC family protein [Streptomyces sp. HNM0574]
MPARFKDIALDALDHQRMADWWSAAIGYQRRQPPAGRTEWPPEWPVLLYDKEGRGPSLWINPVTEPKSGKNRMHMDVYGDTAKLLAMGATLVRRRDDTIDWDVLADPEGNEFCVFEPRKDPHSEAYPSHAHHDSPGGHDPRHRDR